jgi:hypothetical protein
MAAEIPAGPPPMMQILSLCFGMEILLSGFLLLTPLPVPPDGAVFLYPIIVLHLSALFTENREI